MGAIWEGCPSCCRQWLTVTSTSWTSASLSNTQMERNGSFYMYRCFMTVVRERTVKTMFLNMPNTWTNTKIQGTSTLQDALWNTVSPSVPDCCRMQLTDHLLHRLLLNEMHLVFNIHQFSVTEVHHYHAVEKNVANNDHVLTQRKEWVDCKHITII